MAFVITEDCIICGTCWHICPTNSIIEYEDTYKIDEETCVECGACIKVCPNAAIVKSSKAKKEAATAEST
ncbi:MAG: 4Fe-4S dicluster domain-containing protein [Candidatus Schekmanbacteria bacterium]|nr:MAG: 4Fe-4S dicluster domain-containing protein [Candidatus Schekmanbacteria bacterium]